MQRQSIFNATSLKTTAITLSLIAGGALFTGQGQVLHAQSNEAANANANQQTELLSKMKAAYAKVNTYQGKGSLVIRPQGQPDAKPQTFQYEAAFDRDANAFKLKRMDVTVVAKENKLLLKAVSINGRHLQMPLPADQPVYESALKRLPFVNMPVTFDLALLFNQSDVIPDNAKPAAADDQGRPGLAFELPIPQQQPGQAQEMIDVTMHLDAQSHLVETVQMKLPVSMQGQQMTIVIDYNYSDVKVNQALPDGALAIDLEGSEAVKSFSALIGQSSGGSSLQGKAAPDFTLKNSEGKNVSLAELQKNHKIVVLDFWATWCGPCRITLPGLQGVANWVKEEKLPVAIYTINQQETVEQATAMFKQMELTLPILMDSQGQVSQTYEISAIPQLLVIHGGKVETIHLGASPTLDEDLKMEIQELLKKS